MTVSNDDPNSALLLPCVWQHRCFLVAALQEYFPFLPPNTNPDSGSEFPGACAVPHVRLAAHPHVPQRGLTECVNVKRLRKP